MKLRLGDSGETVDRRGNRTATATYWSVGLPQISLWSVSVRSAAGRLLRSTDTWCDSDGKQHTTAAAAIAESRRLESA